jgi:hypothetical protein
LVLVADLLGVDFPDYYVALDIEARKTYLFAPNRYADDLLFVQLFLFVFMDLDLLHRFIADISPHA